MPENGVLTILVNPELDPAGKPTGEGQVFMQIDNTDQLGKALQEMVPDIDAMSMDVFKRESTFGVPLAELKGYLAQSSQNRSKILPTKGIPLDSISGGMSEFQQWVQAARTVNEDIKIALKADAKTPYKTVKRVMSELQDMDESHYYMITNLKKQEDE